jgi:flagellar biosynthesis GTPase FlhF
MNAGSFNTPALLAALSAKASEAEDDTEDTDTEEFDESDDGETSDDEAITDILDPLGLLLGQRTRRLSPRNYTNGIGGSANGIIHTPQGNLSIQLRDVVRKRDLEVALNRVRQDVKQLSNQVSESEKRQARSAAATGQKLKALERDQKKQRKAQAATERRLREMNDLTMFQAMMGPPSLKHLDVTSPNGTSSSLEVKKTEYASSALNMLMLMMAMSGGGFGGTNSSGGGMNPAMMWMVLPALLNPNK